MSQVARGINLDTSVGYLLKEASSALRAAMEAALSPLGLTVTQYSCLELLAQRPGLSGSELARGTFITRQSMSVLLHSLEESGLVERSAEPPAGKALPVRLAPAGRDAIRAASTAVKSVEQRMLAQLEGYTEDDARNILTSMTVALRESRVPAASE